MSQQHQAAVTGAIIDSAIKVHKALGPGLLENAYELCLAHELRKRGFAVDAQVALPLIYDGVEIGAGYRIDLVVNHAIVIEVKACAEILPVHKAQLLTYLKLSELKVGLLFNFHVALLKQGIVRMIL